jgi:hypothetical protein
MPRKSGIFLLMNLRSLPTAIVLSLVALSGMAQTDDARTHNHHLFDSLQHDIVTGWCRPEGLMTAGPYPARKTKKLKEFLQMLNIIYAEGLGEEEILNKVRKHRPTKYRVDSVQMGLMQAVTCSVWVLDYLTVNIHLTCLDGQVLARRLELKPWTTRWCMNRSEKFYDMDYLNQVYAPVLNFPLRNMYSDYLYSARLSPEVIRRTAAAHPECRFTLPDDTLSDSLNNTLAGQYYFSDGDHLYFEQPDRRFLRLVRTDDVRTLTTLLYSPNYFFAVSAMHSLNYLKSIGKADLTPTLSNQIERIKNGRYLIRFQHSNVVYPCYRYSDLKENDDWFIRQYREALQNKTTPSSGSSPDSPAPHGSHGN